MKREYTTGDILTYVGEQDSLKGKVIQLDSKHGDCWGTVSDEDGVYTAQYLDNNYELVGRTVHMPNNTQENANRYLTESGKQLYDVLKDDLLTPEQFEGFVLGNIYKYVKRYKHKNGVKDLKKAKDYIDLLIIDMEGNKDE